MAEVVTRRSTRWIQLLLGAAITGCAPAVIPQPVMVLPPPLPSPLTEVEAAAASTLLELGDRRELRPTFLELAVSAPEPAIRSRAALAAGRIGGPESRPIVERLLSDPDSMVASAAAFAAGILVDTAAIELLANRLEQGLAAESPSVAVEAALALGKIGTERGRQILSSYLSTADPADADQGRVAAAVLLGAWRAGERSTEPYSPWLASSDSEIRWRAVYALTRPARASAVRLILPGIEDVDPLVRAFTLRGLRASVVDSAGVGRQEVVSRLLPLVGDSSYSVRIEAIQTLATYGPGPALDEVQGHLAQGANPHERVAAIESIGRLGEAGSIAAPALRSIALDYGEPDYVRSVAVIAAAQVDHQGAPAFLAPFSADVAWRVRAAAATALSGTGVGGLALLQQLANDADPRVAAEAVRTAPSVVDSTQLQRVKALLLRALQARDLYVRTAALEGLRELADPTMFSVFLDAFDVARQDRQNDAQLAAIDIIASLQNRGIHAPERAFFARFSRSDDYLVRLRAVQRFGASARNAWGNPLPIETGVTAATYGSYIDRWVVPGEPKAHRPRVLIETDRGSMEVRLFSDLAPLTVANFLNLARSGFFDGQEWPRVVPNFVVQGGDPRGDTSGGPGYSIRDEINRERYGTGTLGMALSGPDTGGSQFFMSLSPQPHLDGIYTVFGEVVSGADVLENILPGDKVLSVTELKGED